MKWSTTLAIGLPPLDEHHHMLFRMVDDFRDILDMSTGGSTYSLFLDLLTRYGRTHFSIEEQYMEQYHCPVAQQNTEDHVRFLAELGNFRQRHAASGYQLADVRALLAMLDQWTSEHVCGIDLQLQQYVSPP